MTMTAGELADREAIRHLLASYNIAGDRGRREEFARVFTEDAVLTTPFFRLETRDGIVHGLFDAQPGAGAGEARRPSFARHNLSTSQIVFNRRDEAEGRTYFTVVTDIGLDHSGVYVDRYRRVEGRWLIASRDVRIDYVAENTTALAAHNEMLQAKRRRV